MLRLSRRQWCGHPLIAELTRLIAELNRQNGLDVYLPSGQVLGSRQEAGEVPIAPAVLLEPRAGREALMAQGRTRYAKPRAAVEADIA